MSILLPVLAGLTGLVAAAAAEPPRHFAFFNRDRAQCRSSSFLNASRLQGAQIKYTWPELEPEKDRYRFDMIREDLDFLTANRKRLFIQLQDVSFDGAIVNVPAYLAATGAARQYDDESGKPAGWVAARWDPAVQVRLHKLMAALGREFDGQIEGIALAETSIEFGRDDRRAPTGFTAAGYRDGIIGNMTALKKAFPQSVAMQYANFMPGEWLPDSDHGYLRSVFEAAWRLGVAVGGPDLLPFRRPQLSHSYPLIRQSSGRVPTGIAVQDGNYAAKDPKSNRRIPLGELMRYAQEELRVDYVFWRNQEPYYSRELLPLLR